MEFIEKVEGEEFVISGDDKECQLKVTNPKSGRYALILAGPEGQEKFIYRLDNNLGWQSSSVESAVKNAISKLLEILDTEERNPCKEMHKYLENKIKSEENN